MSESNDHIIIINDEDSGVEPQLQTSDPQEAQPPEMAFSDAGSDSVHSKLYDRRMFNVSPSKLSVVNFPVDGIDGASASGDVRSSKRKVVNFPVDGKRRRNVWLGFSNPPSPPKKPRVDNPPRPKQVSMQLRRRGLLPPRESEPDVPN